MVLASLATRADPTRQPDWLLALLFGIGGAAGGYVGARLNRRLPETWLRVIIGAIAVAVAASYIRPFAQLFDGRFERPLSAARR